MSDIGVDPEAVIGRLSNQIGAMAAELAMRDVALQAAQQQLAEKDAELARLAQANEQLQKSAPDAAETSPSQREE